MDNKSIIIIIAVAAVIAVVAAVVIMSTPQQPETDGVETTLQIDNGLTCTLNGKAVKDGQTITVPLDNGKITLHVESVVAEKIGYSGKWVSGLITERSMLIIDEMVTKYDFVIEFSHPGFVGNLAVGYADADDTRPVTVDFTIGDNLTVMYGTHEIKNGDSYTFYKDAELTVTTNDGKRHYISHQGEWGNDCEYASDGGTELTENLIVYIFDNFYFGDATGYEKIEISTAD